MGEINDRAMRVLLSFPLLSLFVRPLSMLTMLRFGATIAPSLSRLNQVFQAAAQMIVSPGPTPTS